MSEHPNYSQPPPSYRQNSTLALFSLIAGILGLTVVPLIGSIAAVILGPMAKREIAESGGNLDGENLAQIGLILGWIGIGLGLVTCCIVAVSFLIPFLLAFLGIAASEFGAILPILLF